MAYQRTGRITKEKKMSEGLNYQRKRVGQTKFLYMKNATEGDLIHPNPLRYIKYEEKEGMVAKKTGKKFTAKSFIFEDVSTGDRIGIQSTGLLAYQMQEYRAGDVLEIEYNGKDEEDRHQTTIIECSLVDEEELNAQAIKKVQDNVEKQEDPEAVSEEEADDLV